MLLRTILFTTVVAGCVDDPRTSATTSSLTAQAPATPTFCYPVRDDNLGPDYCEARWIGCQNGWPIDYQEWPWPIACPFPELGYECYCSFVDLEQRGDPQECYADYRDCIVRVDRRNPPPPPP